MKNIEGIKKENLSKQIIRALSRYILENKLKSGDKLPTEMELAEQFQVGRNVVREALKALEVIGLVHSKPSVGTILSLDGADPSLLPLVFGLVLQDTGMQYLSEMRHVIEQGSISLAIENASEEQIQELKRLGHDLDSRRMLLLEDEDEKLEMEIEKLEIEFHQKLVALTGNPILIKFSMLWDVIFNRAGSTEALRIKNQLARGGDTGRISHVELAESISERNLEKARDCLQQHLRFWLQNEKSISNDAFLDLVK